MEKKDMQHYVSQSYLRNFSPDQIAYQKQKDTLDDRKRKRFREKMKIHYFEIDEYNYDFKSIRSIARENCFLLPDVDKIVQETENKLSLLGEIIEYESEDFLYQNGHQQTLIEIANCLIARSLVFRTHAAIHCAFTTCELITKDGNKLAELIYTDEGAKFFQTALLTNDIEIILPLLLGAYRFVDSSDDSSATFQERFDRQGIDIDEFIHSIRDKIQQPKQSFLSNTLYPILIKNNSEFQLITGDVCVPKTEYVLADLKTKIPIFHFPICPDLSIIFLEHKDHEVHFQRQTTNKWDIFKLNRLIYNCSDKFLFASSRTPLQWVTRLPKDFESIVQDLKR